MYIDIYTPSCGGFIWHGTKTPNDSIEDVAVNELDFMGEYFFRKDMPQTHFAWFQPRFSEGAEKEIWANTGNLSIKSGGLKHQSWEFSTMGI